jgi:hypothetical protein
MGDPDVDLGGRMDANVKIRRLLLDVDKAVARPSVVELARAIGAAVGVEAVNVTVTEIDVETVGMNVTVEGDAVDYDAVVAAIEAAGAVVHSVDEVVVGSRTIETVERRR